MYMVYMVAGVLFIMLGGIDLAYTHLWLSSDDTEEPELEGHPVKFNKTGALIPVVSSILNFNVQVIIKLFVDGYYVLRLQFTGRRRLEPGF